MVKHKMEQAAMSQRAQSGANLVFWLGLIATIVVTLPFFVAFAIEERTENLYEETQQQRTIETLSERIQELSEEVESLK